MENSTMGNWKDKENCILQLEIIMLDNLGSTKRKEEEYIIGLERKVTCMRDNSKEEKGMDEVHFGGVMEVGMRDNLEMCSEW